MNGTVILGAWIAVFLTFGIFSYLYKDMSIQNGHPDCHFEPMMYAALSEYDFDYDKDLYHTDSILKLKSLYGDEPVYYNFTFPDSKTIHHDERGNIR